MFRGRRGKFAKAERSMEIDEDEDEEVFSFVFQTPRSKDAKDAINFEEVHFDDDPKFTFSDNIPIEDEIKSKIKKKSKFVQKEIIIKEEEEDDEVMSFEFETETPIEDSFDSSSSKKFQLDKDIWFLVCRLFPENFLEIPALNKQWLQLQQRVKSSCIFDIFFAQDWTDMREQRDFIGCAGLLSLAQKFFSFHKSNFVKDHLGRTFILVDDTHSMPIAKDDEIFFCADLKSYHRTKESTPIPHKVKHVIIQYGYQIERGWPLNINAASEEHPLLDNTLETLWLPGADVIGDHALAYCVGLHSIAAPVTSTVGTQAFHFCSSLQIIHLPFASRLNDQEAFTQCNRLATLSLPMHQNRLDGIEDILSDDEEDIQETNHKSVPPFIQEMTTARRLKTGLAALITSTTTRKVTKRNRFATTTEQRDEDETTKIDDDYMNFQLDEDDEYEYTVWDITCREFAFDLLQIKAPNKQFLQAQQRVRSAEIFDVFFAQDWTDCREQRDFIGISTLLQLIKKFFRGRSHHIKENGRSYILIDDDDDDWGSGLNQNNELLSLLLADNTYNSMRPDEIFLFVDLRQYHHRKQATSLPVVQARVRHIYIQYGFEIQRNGELYDKEQGPSKPLMNNHLETLWLPAADIIKRNAAAYCKNLQVLAAPVCTKIESEAFRYCTSLRIVSNPFIVEIGHNAFRDCFHLLHVSLKSCQIITMAAFHSCERLECIEIPQVITVNTDAFFNAEKLKQIYMPFVTCIDARAFGNNYSLEKIDAPLCIKIGANAFQNCTSLQDLDTFIAVTEIGHRAFRGCHSLRRIMLPSLDIIGVEAFCANIQLRAFSSPATLIGDRAFRMCFRLITLDLPFGEILCQEACRDCFRLEEVNVPNLHTVGDRSFLNCVFLIDINVALFPQAVRIGEDVFDDPVSDHCFDFGVLTPETPPSRPQCTTARSIIAAERKRQEEEARRKDKEAAAVAAESAKAVAKCREEEELFSARKKDDLDDNDDAIMLYANFIDEDGDNVDIDDLL